MRSAEGKARTVIDATGRLVVALGLIDINTQLQEPGWEEDETIATGTAAALAGGFTSIACGPNTILPLILKAASSSCSIRLRSPRTATSFVLACVSKNRDGEQLAELGTLHEAGRCGLHGRGTPDPQRGLDASSSGQYSQMFNRPVLNHPEVFELEPRRRHARRARVDDPGTASTMPAEAEDVMTGRDIRLVGGDSGPQLHLLNISSGGSVELLRRAKHRRQYRTLPRGLRRTTLHSPTKWLRSFDSNCKVNPPFRSDATRLSNALQGLEDDTLDVICSGHSPRAHEKKIHELDRAPFGMNALRDDVRPRREVLAIEPGHLTWLKAIEKLSLNDRQAILDLGRSSGTLQAGGFADMHDYRHH